MINKYVNRLIQSTFLIINQNYQIHAFNDIIQFFFVKIIKKFIIVMALNSYLWFNT